MRKRNLQNQTDNLNLPIRIFIVQPSLQITDRMNMIRNQLHTKNIQFSQQTGFQSIKQLILDQQHQNIAIINNQQLKDRQIPIQIIERHPYLRIYCYPIESKKFKVLKNIGQLLKKINQHNKATITSGQQRIKIKSMKVSMQKSSDRHFKEYYDKIILFNSYQPSQNFQNLCKSLLSEPIVRQIRGENQLIKINGKKIILITEIDAANQINHFLIDHRLDKKIDVAILGVKKLKILNNKNIKIFTQNPIQILEYLQDVGLDTKNIMYRFNRSQKQIRTKKNIDLANSYKQIIKSNKTSSQTSFDADRYGFSNNRVPQKLVMENMNQSNQTKVGEYEFNLKKLVSNSIESQEIKQNNQIDQIQNQIIQSPQNDQAFNTLKVQNQKNNSSDNILSKQVPILQQQQNNIILDNNIIHEVSEQYRSSFKQSPFCEKPEKNMNQGTVKSDAHNLSKLKQDQNILKVNNQILPQTPVKHIDNAVISEGPKQTRINSINEQFQRAKYQNKRRIRINNDNYPVSNIIQNPLSSLNNQKDKYIASSRVYKQSPKQLQPNNLQKSNNDQLFTNNRRPISQQYSQGNIVHSYTIVKKPQEQISRHIYHPKSTSQPKQIRQTINYQNRSINNSSIPNHNTQSQLSHTSNTNYTIYSRSVQKNKPIRYQYKNSNMQHQARILDAKSFNLDEYKRMVDQNGRVYYLSKISKPIQHYSTYKNDRELKRKDPQKLIKYLPKCNNTLEQYQIGHTEQYKYSQQRLRNSNSNSFNSDSSYRSYLASRNNQNSQVKNLLNKQSVKNIYYNNSKYLPQNSQRIINNNASFNVYSNRDKDSSNQNRIEYQQLNKNINIKKIERKNVEHNNMARVHETNQLKDDQSYDNETFQQNTLPINSPYTSDSQTKKVRDIYTNNITSQNQYQKPQIQNIGIKKSNQSQKNKIFIDIKHQNNNRFNQLKDKHFLQTYQIHYFNQISQVTPQTNSILILHPQTNYTGQIIPVRHFQNVYMLGFTSKVPRGVIRILQNDLQYIL